MSRPRALGAAVAALALAAAGAACGGDASAVRPTLVVAAAASLERPLGAYAERFADARVRLSFAGSDVLAEQLRRGARFDVLLSADAALAAELASEGLVGRPVAFARNRLVVAVARGATAIDAVEDLARPGATVALGSAGVPVGRYARRALDRLPARTRAGILRNVRSHEPDVRGVVGKVAQGAVDAGLVYASDVRAAAGRLRAVELSPAARVDGTYAAAIATRSRHGAQARAFLAGLIAGPGRAELEAAGFEPPAS